LLVARLIRKVSGLSPGQHHVTPEVKRRSK
jgi:hypothetical protein